MGLRIKTNVASLTAQRQMEGTSNRMGENMIKLSSGYRINKSADDAAGLAISENLRANIASLEQAKRNANDGISLIQVAEGSMNEVSNILVRLRELSTQSASDTISNAEREFTNKEYVALVDEVDRIVASTTFNGIKLLQGSEGNEGQSELWFHIGAGDGTVPNRDRLTVSVDSMKINTQELNLGKGSEIGPAETGGSFARESAAEKLATVDTALMKVNSTRSSLGALQSRLNSAISNLGIQVENQSAAKSRIKDVDFASETAAFTQNKILQQSGAVVLAQANSVPEIALALIKG